MVKTFTKKLAFDVMCIKPVNIGLRGVLKPFARHLPYRLVTNIPAVGNINLELPNNKQLVLVSDGRDSLASRIYWNGTNGFEPNTTKLFLNLVEQANMVFDIGAHIGWFSLMAAIHKESVKVHAFEPVPRIYDYLTGNISANHVDNITAVLCALTDFDGETSLFIPDSIRLPATASIVEGYREETTEVVVQALKLDTYVSEHNIEAVDLIKIDAEGAEANVFMGAAEIIKRDSPTFICEILYGIVDPRIQTIFDNTDYQFFLIVKDGLIHHEQIVGDEDFFYKNYLFISEAKIPQLLQGIDIIY